MSLLHAFYCWGSVGVVIAYTVFFRVFGLERWKLLACLWALVPLLNIYNFAIYPIEPPCLPCLPWLGISAAPWVPGWWELCRSG